HRFELSVLLRRPPSTFRHTPSLHDALPISECLPKVRGHRFHSLSLLGAQAGQGRLRRFFVPPRRHLQNPPTLDIRQNGGVALSLDRKSTRLNSSHVKISYAVFCLKKKNKKQ